MATRTDSQRRVLAAVELWEKIRGDLFLIAVGFVLVFTIGVLI